MNFLHNLKKLIVTPLLLLMGFNVFAQSSSSYHRVDTISVYQYNRKLLFPWVGGLNSPQLSSVNLTSEGVNLLVIFDRCGEHFYTFYNQQIKDSISYVYDPSYEKNFPVCHNWALLRDYNCDGIPDIFSSTYNGVNVFRGYYNSNNELAFTLASAQLMFPFSFYNTNVFVPGADLPAIDDIDGDGDLDVLAFGVTGGYINYYKNISEESGYGCDSLKYVWQSPCWGNVFENYWLTMMLNVCAGFSFAPRGTINQAQHHAGNTLCTYVEDSTGDNKSAIWGGISFPHSVFLHNVGLNDTAHIDWEDTSYPVFNVADSIRSFPACYHLDLNNDGYDDLLFAPNYTFGTQDFNNIRYYERIPGRKTGTREFQYYSYRNDSLFSKDMIDVGSGSAPAFFHYFNGDTAINDLVIGSIGRYNINGVPNGTLTLYRNTGTPSHPAFTLVTRDFANISNYKLTAVDPAFGDLRGTGTEDMILGNSTGTLYYFENIAANGDPAQYQLIDEFFDSISVGGNSAPQLVDVDGDGLLDLVVGCLHGTLYYYHNIGTKTAPKFQLVSSNWGGIWVADTAIGYYTGYSCPFLYRDSTGKHVLLVGSQDGRIFRYDSIDNNLDGIFERTDTAFAEIHNGFLSQCTVTGANLLGGNSLDLAIGNYRGGLNIYTTSPVPSGIAQTPTPQLFCTLYPNPADDEITLSLPGVSQYDMVNVDVENILGQIVLTKTVENSQTKITLGISQLSPGLYFCRISVNGNFIVRKFIVAHK